MDYSISSPTDSPDETMKCEVCSQLRLIEDFDDPDNWHGHHYCGACVEDQRTNCSHCEATVLVDLAPVDADGHSICVECKAADDEAAQADSAHAAYYEHSRFTF